MGTATILEAVEDAVDPHIQRMSPMSNQNVAAEIVPQPHRAQSAAKALQELGFRVLRIDATISIQAPVQVWEDVFHVSFGQQRKDRLSTSPESSIEHADAPDQVQIPAPLSDLIAEVLFVQPPEFF